MILTMVKHLQDAARSPKSAKTLLVEQGVRMHLFADSAEGIRSSMDRGLASERASSARQRVLKRPAA
jgi:hypothetical protein